MFLAEAFTEVEGWASAKGKSESCTSSGDLQLSLCWLRSQLHQMRAELVGWDVSSKPTKIEIAQNWRRTTGTRVIPTIKSPTQSQNDPNFVAGALL